ncbi:MAG: 1-pyrroline-5-carboxylate dehydrogenase [Candidatus Cloacimonadota bacterium]|nr:MAG: 1-pyrroline-5-carboxylate dehydrogenase [Candidatus Cloacimonadota bacterium]
MQNIVSRIPKPVNEPIKSYAPGTIERAELRKAVDKMKNEQIEIPLIIGGKEVKTGNTGKCIEPHNHKNVLAIYHKAGEKEVKAAIEAAMKAQKEWAAMPYEMRAGIFLKAAELLSKKYRYLLNAATMLNQSKSPFQAEIDSACELIDFLRFNSYYMQQIYTEQPMYSPTGMWNMVEHRNLEGFVFAVTPFNFTAIGGNLPTSPAMMGNVVLWKPASTAVLANYYFMKILQEAGLPDGVINFIPGSGSQVGDPVLASEHFAGLHFTGSTKVFNGMWKTIGENMDKYKTYPRIVGETGGKDFIFVHKSADEKALIPAIIRGAFEYQGQKCSAASRAYIPKTIWNNIKDKLIEEIKTITVGSTVDFGNFFNAVIDKASFDNCKSYIEHAQKSADAEIIVGGECDDSIGYFVNPTVIVTTDPKYKSMQEEIFGPIITVYVYEDEKYEETLELCDQTSVYALTGAVFANDRKAVATAVNALRQAAGNFYINDKPTGAVVGQQPFGGARGSGTNDKAGSMINLQRWVSVRTIKETFMPPYDYRYPFLEKE